MKRGTVKERETDKASNGIMEWIERWKDSRQLKDYWFWSE